MNLGGRRGLHKQRGQLLHSLLDLPSAGEGEPGNTGRAKVLPAFGLGEVAHFGDGLHAAPLGGEETCHQAGDPLALQAGGLVEKSKEGGGGSSSPYGRGEDEGVVAFNRGDGLQRGLRILAEAGLSDRLKGLQGHLMACGGEPLLQTQRNFAGVAGLGIEDDSNVHLILLSTMDEQIC